MANRATPVKFHKLFLKAALNDDCAGAQAAKTEREIRGLLDVIGASAR